MYRLPRKEFTFRWERAQGQYARFISYEASVLSLRSLPPEYKLFARYPIDNYRTLKICNMTKNHTSLKS